MLQMGNPPDKEVQHAESRQFGNIHAGISVYALALHQKGNLWVTSNLSPHFPMQKIPPGASIMEQFKILAGSTLTYPNPPAACLSGT
jgi:hypothetical protein